MGQEYWSGLPCPPPGNPPDPGIEPMSPVAPALYSDSHRWANREVPSPGDSISNDLKRTALRRSGEEPGYIEVLQQRAGSLNIKRLLLIKGRQICQVKEFSSFLCMGRCKSPGSLKSFFPHASPLSGAGVPCFSQPGLPWGSPNYSGVVAVCWLPGCSCSSPSWVPWGLEAHRGGLQSPTTVTILVYWYGRKYSSFQSLPLVRNLTNIWETFHDQFLFHSAGKLIPD